MLPRQSLLAPATLPRRARPNLPSCWLMTDRRLGPAMPAIVAAMPPRSGVIIRPYAMDTQGRTATIRAIRRIGRAKRHLVLMAGRRIQGYDGRHGGGPAGLGARRPGGRILSLPVHDDREAARAIRLRASLCLISPVWPTRSHPDATGLGLRGFARLAARPGKVSHVIALGGMTANSFRALRHHGAHGWAAIDGWKREKPSPV